VAPELREQLQVHLGTSYTLERELGGGGMSRVFLAHEVRLGRTVVVKVLPPQMAAGVSVDRFEREIQLAAKLQHPHIVPLLTAGSAGDLLYYIMPHIEGESLRGRLMRDHELPVGETVRILHDVVDALAYAHAHGIVHRDIKPDNVLLSGKHALVTDFGVAKAVADSTGKTALTSLGVALGTPAYMAPEQAAADPQVDHRADLYAVGTLAYEMLTGRPPFTGTSPQAVLAAQITRSPEPITNERASVPPALAALVMRCLEKKPADRLQAAEELLGQLEAVATPSGTEATIRRAQPVRVAALFIAASAGLLTVVYWLMRGLGLPDWVFPGAVALLLIGLPIMVVTGLVERRRAIARSTGRVESHAPVGLQQWLTWRRALVGGGLAFGALGVGAAGYMAMRLLGIGPLGTLVASGVIKNREPLVLANFDNRTADSTLGPSLTEAFRVDLSQSPTVRLVDPAALAGALVRMQRPPGTPLDAALARELAERERAKAVVVGEVDPVGKGYVLSASLVSSADGHVLTAVRETAADDGALIRAMDRLSRKLRERIGESLRTIRASAPLEQVTTASLEALRKYTEGVRADDEGDFERALPLYQEATAIDTGFAMAYRKVVSTLGNIDSSNAARVAAATKAFQLRNRLPEAERDLAIATYYQAVYHDRQKALSACRAALERDPDNTVALACVAFLLNLRRQWREAESLAVQATALGMGSIAVYQAAFAQAGEGHYDDAQATVARFAQIAPYSPMASISGAQGDYTTAERDLRRLRAEQRGGPSWQARSTRFLARLHEITGKLGQTERDYREYMAESEQRGLAGEYVAGAIWLGSLGVRYRHAPLTGLRAVEAALAHHPLNSIPVLDRPYPALAEFYAEAGRPDVAKQLLDEYERVVPEGARREDPLRLAAAGAIALAEGRNQDAVLAYQAWSEQPRFLWGTEGLFELAVAYERAGQSDSALALYDRVVSTPHLDRTASDAHALGPSLKRLGELYETRGDLAKARDYYSRFVDLWKDADPELQPVVRDARARIARLAGEH
jgi:eukaryotic-like serine/threonine-protein kinase